MDALAYSDPADRPVLLGSNLLWAARSGAIWNWHGPLNGKGTGNLDPDLSAEVMRLFQDFNQVGVTVLIASHDLALIAQLKHRVLTLKEGRMALSGKAQAHGTVKI